jgi:hypothetical protein
MIEAEIESLQYAGWMPRNAYVFHFRFQEPRKQGQRGKFARNGALADFQNRWLEFEDFEREFEECVSKSASKFEQHSQTALANVTIRNQHRMKLRIECEKCKSEQMWNFTTINVVNSPQSRLRCIPHNGRCRFSRVSERENSAQVLIDDSNIPLHPEPFSFADVYECTKAENGFKFTRLDPLGEWMRKTRGNGKFICLKTEDSRGGNHSGSCYRLDRDRFMTTIPLPVSPGRD